MARLPVLLSCRLLAMSLAVVALLAGIALPATAQVSQTSAPHAILIDYETKSVLFQKDADARMPPASLAKLMTIAVVFEALKAGKLKLDDQFTVSENAWRTGGAPSGGSTMFAELGSSIRVEDLIHAIIIQSANDGCIVIAEGMAGSESAFAEIMNAEAQRLGLTGSQFRNATGLPDPEQYVTARDLAKLAQHIITNFPQYYPIYAQTEFTWNKITQRNRNPLLEMNLGADGMKTGYTSEAGYGLVGSTVQKGQRLILVVSGLKTEKERADEARKLLEWGYRAFERVTLFQANEVIAEARVFGGEKGGVPLAAKEPVEILRARGAEEPLRGRIVYKGPLPAPVAEGAEIGTLQITANDVLLREETVYATEAIATGSVTQRAIGGMQELLLGWW